MEGAAAAANDFSLAVVVDGGGDGGGDIVSRLAAGRGGGRGGGSRGGSRGKKPLLIVVAGGLRRWDILR